MNFAIPDYVILSLAAGGAVTGLFIGVSGSLAFLAGAAAAFFAGRFGWPFSAAWFESSLARGFAVGLLVFFAFWIVRAVVKRTVKLAVAQPGDAIFGAIVASVSGFALGMAVVWLGQFFCVPGMEESVIFAKVLSNVG